MRPKSTSLKARFAQMAALLVLSFAALLSTPPASAAAMSNYLETALINHIFRGTPYTAPGRCTSRSTPAPAAMLAAEPR